MQGQWRGGKGMHSGEETLSNILREENVICQLDAQTGEQAIEALARLLHRNENGFDWQAVVTTCNERERAYSTVIAPGLALPHARVAGLPKLMVAVGTSTAGIAFQAADRGPVNVVVLILTPKSAPGLYLQALAALMRHFSDPAAVQQVAALPSARAVCEFFSERAEALPPYLTAQDIMEHNVPTLLESDDLESAIRLFCSKKLLDIPVVDEEGDLRGALALEDLLRVSLPEHLLWMEDLAPIIRFEPFADLLRREKESRVADVMRDKCLTVGPAVPAMELARLFLIQKVRQIIVVDGRKYLGTVDLSVFMSKIIWA